MIEYPDYEALILERQETLEILEDQCDYRCEKCILRIPVKQVGREWLYRCGLNDDRG